MCEFSGAVLFGGAVTETIRKGIADVAAYEREPEVLMYGMMCVLLAVGLWLLVATKLGFPVSTTHSTVGAVVGMSMVARGASSVYWGDETTRTFPWLTGLAKIILSWVFSPILSAAAAASLFVALRVLVLRRADPSRAALAALPAIVGLTAALNTFLLLTKGTASRGKTDAWPAGKTAFVCLGVGAGALAAAAALCRRCAAAWRRLSRSPRRSTWRALGGPAKGARRLRRAFRWKTPRVCVRRHCDGGPGGDGGRLAAARPRRDSFASFQGGLGTSETSARDSGRSGAPPSSAMTQAETLAAEEEERREFGCHYGLREWAQARMTPSYDATHGIGGVWRVARGARRARQRRALRRQGGDAADVPAGVHGVRGLVRARRERRRERVRAVRGNLGHLPNRGDGARHARRCGRWSSAAAG